MNNQNHPAPPAGAVVVGIALDGYQAALVFAADEASRTHSPLHLLHVLQLSSAEAYAGVLQGAREAADQALAQALADARDLVDGQVPVTGEQVVGEPLVAALLDRASRGSMLVLEHRRLGPLRRFVTGSTVAVVASRSAVPVVSVPEGWTPGTKEGVVTVGVQDADGCAPLIRRGLLEARTRGASVEVVNAWHIGGGYDTVVSDRDFRTTAERRIGREMAPALEVARTEVPGVPLRLRVQHADPADALLASGSSSQLLVIGRRHHLLPIGSHVGPVARAILQHATVPVLLEPATPRKVRVTQTVLASRVVQPA